MSNYIIGFDKSKDDVPTLVVMRESYLIYPFDPTIDVVKTITGDKAVRIFEELTKEDQNGQS